MIRIENWELIPNPRILVHPEIPTEALPYCLHGTVYNHPLIPDGENVYTSTVEEINGNTVQTRTGHKYILGEKR